MLSVRGCVNTDSSRCDCLKFPIQRKAERLEQLRDDPYYIIDDQPLKPTANNVDAIPVVKLEGMGSLLPRELLNTLSIRQ